MIYVEHIRRADPAARAVAGYRQIDRQAFYEFQRLRHAIGGKAARAIFADLLLVRGGEKARARPGRKIEAEPRGACLDRIAVSELVAADEIDVAGHRKTRAEAMARREVDARIFPAQCEFGDRKSTRMNSSH